MKCKICKNGLNMSWYMIHIDGKYQSIGKITSRKIQLDIAKSIYDGSYLCYQSGTKIEVEKLNHCFNCGGYRKELVYFEIKGRDWRIGGKQNAE